MLFASFTNTTITAINNTESHIKYLEQQLEQARRELAQLEIENQAQLTAKSAAENALEMVRKARKMVAVAFGDKGVHEFNLALVDDLGEKPEILLQPGDETAETVEAAPVAPTPDSSEIPVITVVAVDIDSNSDSNSDIAVKKEVVSESHPEPDYSKLSWKQLQRFAASYGVSPKGRKRPDIETELTLMGIDQNDIDSAA